MSEATIPLADSSSLLSLFGTRDQHLRKIRDSLGVSVSGRNDRIHIEGPDEAVAKATEVFEKIKEMVDRYGVVSPEEVSQMLGLVTGQVAGRRSPGHRAAVCRQADPPAHRRPGPLRVGHSRSRPGVLRRAGRHRQDVPGRGHGGASAQAGDDPQDRAGAAGGRGRREPGLSARRLAGQDQSRTCGRCWTPCAR